MNIARLLAFSLLCGLVHASAEPIDEFLLKARAQLGPEKALEAVESIRYAGEVLSPSGEKIADLELIFDAPNRQLLRERRGDTVQQTAVNGYEGYIMTDDGTGEPIIAVLRPGQVKRLMANAIENLNFFDGPNKMRKASIIDEGETVHNGKPARKVRFEYPLGLNYIRYFDPETGMLLATESRDGMNDLTLIEVESLQSGGIKFPRKVDTYNADGSLVRSVVFSEVVVNGPVEAGVFDFPE